MDYAPCVVHLGSFQASGWFAEAHAATAAGRHGGARRHASVLVPGVLYGLRYQVKKGERAEEVLTEARVGRRGRAA